MVRTPARLRRVVAVIAVAMSLCLLVTGCGRILGPRELTMSASRADGTPYTIRVRDTSGRIENMEIDPVEPVEAADAVTNPPGQPNVAIVPWLGGACGTRSPTSPSRAAAPAWRSRSRPPPARESARPLASPTS